MIKKALVLALSTLLSGAPSWAALGQAPRVSASANTGASARTGSISASAAPSAAISGPAALSAPAAALAAPGAAPAAAAASAQAAVQAAARVDGAPDVQGALAEDVRQLQAAEPGREGETLAKMVDGAQARPAESASVKANGGSGVLRAGARLRKYVTGALAGLMLGTQLAGAAAAPLAQPAVPAQQVMILAQADAAKVPVLAGQVQPAYVRDLKDLISSFNPAKKVYVVGDAQARGYISEQQLAAIGRYVQNKPYYVVIMADGVGPAFRITRPDGAQLEGRNSYDDARDAVNVAVNDLLYKRAAESVPVDARTGKNPVAVYGLVIDRANPDNGLPESFRPYFRGSESMRALGLDTRDGRPFKGDLARAAVQGFRNDGRNFARGIEDTFKQIETLMENRLRQLGQENASALTAARNAVEFLASAEAATPEAKPANGSAALAARVAQAEKLLGEHKRAEAFAMLREVNRQASESLQAVRGFAADQQTSTQRLEAVKKDIGPALDKVAAFTKDFPNADIKINEMTLKEASSKWQETLKVAQGKLKSQPAAAAQELGTLAGEMRSAEALMTSFTSAYERVESGVTAMKGAFKNVETAAAAVAKKATGDGTGDLAKPGLAAWRQTLSQIEAKLKTDPSGAESELRSLQSQLNGYFAKVNEFNGGFKRLSDAKALFETLSGHSDRGAAAEHMTQAEQSLRLAQAAHGAAQSAWSDYMASAERALNQAETTMQAATQSRIQGYWNWAIGIASALGLFLLGSIGASFSPRRRKAKKLALERLGEWDKFFKGEQENLVKSLDPDIRAYAAADSKWTGATKKLAQTARVDNGEATLLLVAARNVFEQAQGIARAKVLGAWTNFVWHGGYERIVKLLDKEPVKLDTSKGLDKEFQRAGLAWDAAAYGTIDKYKQVDTTFAELTKRFEENVKASRDAVEKIKSAASAAAQMGKDIAAAIKAAQDTQAALNTPDGLFLLPSLYSEAIPAAEKHAATLARKLEAEDPVGAIENGGEEAKRISSDAQALVKAVIAARAGAMKQALASAAELVKAGHSSEWVAERIAKLSKYANTVASSVAEKPAAEKIAKIESDFAAIASDAASAVAQAKALAEARQQQALGLEKIAEARASIASRTGSKAEDMLREEKADPDAFMSEAGKSENSARRAIDEGDLNAASATIADMNRALASASSIVRTALETLAGHGEASKKLAALTGTLEKTGEQRAELLAGLEKRFLAKALELRKGDVAYANANGKITDNIDEADVQLTAAKKKLQDSADAYAKGLMIRAAVLLQQVQAHQEIAQHRYDEISSKAQALDALVAENKKTIADLDEKLEQRDKTFQDMRTTAATFEAYGGVKGGIDAAKALQSGAKSDPFDAAAKLAAASAAFEKLWIAARNDHDMHAEAKRSLDAAIKQFEAADQWSAKFEADEHRDSAEVDAAQRQLAALKKRYNAAADGIDPAKLGKKRGDWKPVDEEADAIVSETAQLIAAFRQQQGLIEEALKEIKKAHNKVSEATSWGSSYVNGSPGGSSLNTARQRLADGDYQGAVQYAEKARQAAANAIAEAEAQLEREREAERRRQAAIRKAQEEAEERAAAAERAARRRSDDSWSSGGSSSGGSIDWGSGSSSGGGYSSGGSSDSIGGGYSSGGSQDSL